MYLLLILSAIFLFLNNLGAKTNKAIGSGNLLNVTLIVGAAGILSWITCFIVGQTVTVDMFVFAVVFAFLFILCMLTTYKAYEKGSMSGTALFSNASLVVVVLFCVLFYQESFGLIRIVGVIGVFIALTLLTLPTKKEKVEDKSSGLTWLILCIVVLLSNSGISITSKIRQMQMGGANPFAYMALCYTVTFVLGVIVYGVMQLKQNTLRNDIGNVKMSLASLSMQTLGNAGANLLVTFLSSKIDGVILYPVNMGGGLILTVVCSYIFFNEKKSIRTVIGLFVGITSIVLLSF